MHPCKCDRVQLFDPSLLHPWMLGCFACHSISKVASQIHFNVQDAACDAPCFVKASQPSLDGSGSLLFFSVFILYKDILIQNWVIEE